MGERRRDKTDQGGGAAGGGEILSRDIEIAANAGAEIGLRGLSAEQRLDCKFFRIGIGLHDRGRDLLLHVPRLSSENARNHAHHVHDAIPPNRSHRSRRWLMNAGASEPLPLRRHTPRMGGIQYARGFSVQSSTSLEYWFARSSLSSGGAKRRPLAGDDEWESGAVIARSGATKQSRVPPATLDCFAEPVIGRAFARP